MKIENYIIDKNSPVFIIAELSANHNGSLETALETVRAAKRAGANCIKLQTFTADTITLNSKKDDFKITQGTLWDGQYLHDLYQSTHLPWEWHKQIIDEAKREGLICFSSPFDPTSVEFLEALNVPAYKIASFEITDIPLIELIASKGKPVIISTGIAEIEDIELALDACKRMGNNDVALLKCTSSYPAPIEEANMCMVKDLAERYGVISGLSDHTMGSTVPVVATVFGAKIIEKHFILNRDIGGADASFSMNEEEFTAMVKAVREAESSIGKVDYTLTEKQKKGKDFCRSLYVVEDIKAGEIITEKNVRSIRPGFGLHPKYYNEILGKKSSKNLFQGDPLKEEDLYIFLKNMKKVALIFSANLSNPTGSSAIIRNFRDSRAILKKHGIDLTVYAPDIENQSVEISVKQETKKGFYGKTAAMFSKFGVNYAVFAIIRLAATYFRSSTVKDYLSKNTKDDVVFFHELFTCYKYIKKRKNNQAKIVLVLHNDGDTYKMLRTEYKTLEKSIFYKYLLRIEQKVLDNVDLLGFSAIYPCQNFTKLHPSFDKNKIFYVYNGLSEGLSVNKSIKDESKVYEICCVGTVMARKGQRFIVEALREMNINSQVPNIHFSIVGGGPLKNELESLSEKYGVSQYITFHGSSSEVNKYLEKSDLFILPSITEGFPIAILEAMKLGLPIVSTNVAGIPEMIQNEHTGIIIEPSTDGVLGFLRNFDKYDWQLMGENSRSSFLEKFTTEKMMKSYAEILNSI